MAFQPLRKIIIPVAGYGTRFLPYTKSIPKEMLPLTDQPIIHHIVKEAVDAGITQVILITGFNKRAIEDYFDYNLELEYLLEKNGKDHQKKLAREASDMANFVFVRQKEQLGTGHAILQAKNLIGATEPFMVVWGDDMFMGKPSRIQQMIDAYNETGAPVIITIPKDADDDYGRYGYVKPGKTVRKGLVEVKNLIEKPGTREAAPSNLASLGCYILNGHIFDILENQKPGKGGEIWLADAINTYASQKPLFALEADNLHYFDCGNKLEYTKAVIEYALKRDDIGKDLAAYLKDLSKKL